VFAMDPEGFIVTATEEDHRRVGHLEWDIAQRILVHCSSFSTDGNLESYVMERDINIARGVPYLECLSGDGSEHVTFELLKRAESSLPVGQRPWDRDKPVTHAPRPPPPRYDGWPDDARALVVRAVVAHGGHPRWSATDCIRLRFEAARGPLFALKGYGQTFFAPREFEVRPHEQVTIFHDYPDAAHRGRFAGGDVRLERVADGAVTRDSPDHRRTFQGLARYRRWDALDALYFFGYALWHYHTVPFALGAARFVRVLYDRGELTGVEVEFPAEVPTHCRRQRFFFGGEDGRITRHDYTAEVIGRWARGCHFWKAYVRAGGLLVARQRRVVACVLGRATAIPVLHVDFGDVVVEPRPSPYAHARRS